MITALRLAELELPDGHPEGPGRCALFGFLVRDAGFSVLVDTGVGTDSALIERMYRPVRHDLEGALRDADCELGAIDAVVNSHLHFDHCGNNPLFAGRPIYVQAAELEAARAPHYTWREWVEFPGASYRAVDGELALSERVSLIPTPGHTPGHQSVLVRGPGGPELVVAQAAYTAREFEAARSPDAPQPDGHWNAARYRQSLAALHALQPSRAYFSHDPEVWSAGG